MIEMVGLLLYSVVVLLAGMFLQNFLISLKDRRKNAWKPLNQQRRRVIP